VGAFVRSRIDGPNLLFISVDTLRADYTSVYGGSVPTPAMAQLGARGTVFDRHYSLAPWTSPSVNAMFASKYPPSLTPSASGDKQWEQMSRYSTSTDYWKGESKTTFVARLNDAGYTTAAFVGNPGIVRDRYLLDDFGYSRVMGLGALEVQDDRGPLTKTIMMRNAARRFVPNLVPKRPFDTTAPLTSQVQQFLRFRAKDRFFLWVHYFDPHMPYDPPTGFRDPRTHCPFDFLPMQATEDQLKHKECIRSLYEGEIRYVDFEIAKLLDTLRELGLEASTYVVLWADHGEEMWDHGRHGHGHSVYNELTHVPLVVAGPDVLSGGRIDAPTSSIDLIPTLADLLGVEPIPGWRGVSLAGILRGSTSNSTASPVYSQATGALGSPEPLQAVVRGRLKLIRGMKSAGVQLYDYVADPGEMQNLADLNPEVVRYLSNELDRWGTTFPVTLDDLAERESTPEADAAAIEILKALGYI
jgi:arylsulfatase A-like enzyme